MAGNQTIAPECNTIKAKVEGQSRARASGFRRNYLPPHSSKRPGLNQKCPWLEKDRICTYRRYRPVCGMNGPLFVARGARRMGFSEALAGRCPRGKIRPQPHTGACGPSQLEFWLAIKSLKQFTRDSLIGLGRMLQIDREADRGFNGGRRET